MVCRISKRDHLPSSPTAAAARARVSFFLTESESGGDDDREKGRGERGQQLGPITGASSCAADNVDDDIEVVVRWNMVFTWQAPMMLLAYSVIAFLVGLTVYICAPLYGDGLRGREAAIFYLASLGVGGLCFIVRIP
ncbi:hypothetical protein F4677DRAFT_57693 [Hypoxylon crocopeplum]|nr:hypothetical protein F4677DRAFT_57693 [Hypoxylon crocopeplum]